MTLWSLWLALAALAAACPVCMSPAPPPAAAAAAAPYDSRGALKLTEAETKILFARYEKRGYFAADPDAAPGEHLLTNRKVLDFVTAAQVRRLKAKPEPDDEDRVLARRLYWTRGEALTAADAAFLRGLTGLRLGSLPEEEGGKKAEFFLTSVVKAGSSGGVDPARSLKALEGLKRVVTRESHGDAAQRDALEDALRRVVSTPTGVELAEELVRLNKPVKVSFEDTGPAGGVAEQNGRKVLQTSGGNMTAASGQPVVRLNKEYLLCSPDWRGPAIAATLAHEMLGHALIWYKAKAAGVSEGNQVYRGDEATAAVVGWLVSAELGGPLSNGHMWRYLADKEDFHKGLLTNLPYYAGTFSRAEMKRPLSTLAARRVLVKEELKRLPAQRAETAANQKLLDHFVNDHGLDRKKVRTLEEGLQNQRAWQASHGKSLEEIDAYITQRETWYATEAGAKEKAKFYAQSDDPYFADAEAREDVLAQRLKTLTAGRAPESSFPPPPAGQLTWADLAAMKAKDKKDNPGHWK